MRPEDQVDYAYATACVVATAVLLAVQEPFSALAARTLSSLEFMAVTQVALLASLAFLLIRTDSRRDFATIILNFRYWPKLIAIFLVGVAGLALYDIGLSSAHPIITAAILNLSPFWAALVAFAVSKRSVSAPRRAFTLCFLVAFVGAMAVAWSQIDFQGRDVPHEIIFSLLHSKWIYALPMPAFFALSGTLVFEWFSDFEEASVIAANFVVSSAILIPAPAIGSELGRQGRLSEQSSAAMLMLLVGTLAASAAGRVFYQKALTATKSDNGYVTMFFLLIPAFSTLISLPLSRWIPTLTFVPGPGFVIGMVLVTGPLILLTLMTRPDRHPKRMRNTAFANRARSPTEA